jgi:hypothetical protein
MMRRRIHQVRPEIAVTRAQQQRQVTDSGRSVDKVDESLQETFPASDPPSWTLSARLGSSRRKRQTSTTE